MAFFFPVLHWYLLSGPTFCLSATQVQGSSCCDLNVCSPFCLHRLLLVLGRRSAHAMPDQAGVLKPGDLKQGGMLFLLNHFSLIIYAIRVNM